MAGLSALQKKFPVIGEVRGKGLFIGMEIIADAKRTPDAKLAKALTNEALNQGLIISATGAYGNNLRITPPLVITPGQVERALAALGEVFARVVPASKTA
jgi:4-aminobutyrate aminotransferase-like enzyme